MGRQRGYSLQGLPFSLKGIDKKVAESIRCLEMDAFLQTKLRTTQVDALSMLFLDAGAVPAASTRVVMA